jgi:phosphoesterase RecJ-like protein
MNGVSQVREPREVPAPEDFQRIRELILQGTSFVLCTHTGPDGDGIGSELVLLRYLRSLGKDVRIVNPDACPDELAFLVRPGEEMEIYDPAAHAGLLDEVDGVFFLDVNNPLRLGALRDVLEALRAPKVCVDHHPPGRNFFDLTYVREEACATAELLFELLEAMGHELTEEMAEPMYVALLTDTGSFRFAKTSAYTHRIAARLLELGVRPHEMYGQLYERLSPARVRLIGDILATLQVECDGKLAWVSLTEEMLARQGATLDDSQDVVNFTIALEGVLVGVLFKELGPGRMKASLRSKGQVDVNGFARGLGGGGHMHAAGIVLEHPFEEGRDRVLAALREALEHS